MLDNITVVLFKPKYPENIGSAARACLNMGCPNLTLVGPRNFDLDKALPLATVAAKGVVESCRVTDTLPEALADATFVYGTCARTGGWRKGIVQPAGAAEEIMAKIREGGRVAIVFGPEDRGLTNEETTICNRLITIPTHKEGTSLNLAQAVLVILYECFKASLTAPFTPAGPPTERPSTHAEQEALFALIQETLTAIDFLKHDNPEYWMLPVRRFLARSTLRRNEFNLLMGICRQINWIAAQAGQKEKDDAAGREDV